MERVPGLSSSKYVVGKPNSEAATPLLAKNRSSGASDQTPAPAGHIASPINQSNIPSVKAQDSKKDAKGTESGLPSQGSAPVISQEARDLIKTLSPGQAKLFAKIIDQDYLMAQLTTWLRDRPRGATAEKLEVNMDEGLFNKKIKMTVKVNGNEAFRAEQVYFSNSRKLAVSISGSKVPKSSKKTFLGSNGKPDQVQEGTSTYANGVETSFNGKTTLLGPDGKVTQVREGTSTYVNGVRTSFNGKLTFLGPDGKVTEVQEGTVTYVNRVRTSLNGKTTLLGPDGKVTQVREGTSTYDVNGVETSFTPKATAA